MLKNGRIYAAKVLNDIGEIEPPEVIFNRINQIYQLKLSDTNCSIGTLTMLDRENWVKLRKHLSTSLVNKIQLGKIDSALFCVSIENSNLIKHMSQLNVFFAADGKNCWFDKSITMAIDIDGTVGISFEHSWGDGRTLQRINEEIYNDLTTSPFITPNTKPPTTTTFDESVPEITFNVDANIECGIKHAIENHTLKIKQFSIHQVE